jgi:hypothetical protein
MSRYQFVLILAGSTKVRLLPCRCYTGTSKHHSGLRAQKWDSLCVVWGQEIVFSRGDKLGKCPNMCPSCTRKPATHCPFIRLVLFLLLLEAGFMSCTRICLFMYSCGALCVQIGRAESPQWPTKKQEGGFAWENSICWPTSPNSWPFHSISFAMMFVYYKDFITPEIMLFGSLGGLLWRICGEK